MTGTLSLSDLTKHFRKALSRDVEPDWSLATKSAWGVLINELANEVSFESLWKSATWVSSRFPDEKRSRLMLELCQQAAMYSSVKPFEPPQGREIVIHHVPGSSKAILIFCGNANRFFMPLTIAHQWFGSLNATVVYLFDYTKSFYFRGLPSFRGGFKETIRDIKAELHLVGISEFYTCGSSSGGYAAIRAATALPANGVLCFSAPTNLSAEFMIEHGVNLNCLPIALDDPDNALELRFEVLQSGHQPNMTLFFGAENTKDRLHSENLAGLPKVVLKPVAGVKGHNALVPSVFSGEWVMALEQLVGN